MAWAAVTLNLVRILNGEHGIIGFSFLHYFDRQNVIRK
jgi:hypothetical protein